MEVSMEVEGRHPGSSSRLRGGPIHWPPPKILRSERYLTAPALRQLSPTPHHPSAPVCFLHLSLSGPPLPPFCNTARINRSHQGTDGRARSKLRQGALGQCINICNLLIRPHNYCILLLSPSPSCQPLLTLSILIPDNLPSPQTSFLFPVHRGSPSVANKFHLRTGCCVLRIDCSPNYFRVEQCLDRQN